MSESDSDDGAPLKRVCSISAPSDKVPKGTDFKLTYKIAGKKSVRLIYTLKKDIFLPYTATIEGILDKLVEFSFLMSHL